MLELEKSLGSKTQPSYYTDEQIGQAGKTKVTHLVSSRINPTAPISRFHYVPLPVGCALPASQ